MPRPEQSPNPPPHGHARGRERRFPQGRGRAVTEHRDAKLAAKATSVRLNPEALNVLSEEAPRVQPAPRQEGPPTAR